MLSAAVKSKIEQIWLDVIAGGVSQPTEVIEQLTYLMFAKQIDEHEADIETAELLSGQNQTHIFGPSKEEQALRWRNFKGMEARELHKHFTERVFVFLITLNLDENSAFSRYLKHATFKINDPLALQKVIVELEDLFENDIKDLDMQGDLYEYMLDKLSTAGHNGQFRTPKHIREMMVNLVQPSPNDYICDPACGTAGFLVSSAEYIRQHYESVMTSEQWKHFTTTMFSGFDTDQTMLRISAMNTMLHSIDNPDIDYKDSVSKQNDIHSKYTLILTNPPFAGTVDSESINDDLKTVANTKKTELLFIALFIRMLKKGGRCACIVPDGVLFGSSKAHKSIRKELVENHQLTAVISMPSGVFKPYAGVSTAVLVFTKTGAGGTDKVWFYDMKADGFSLDDKRTEIAENDIPDILERFHNMEKEADRKRTEQSFFVPKEEIAQNGYDLSINKYKKVEYVPVEYPPTQEILSELQELEKQITVGLTELEGML